jgi:hypothetical protein
MANDLPPKAGDKHSDIDPTCSAVASDKNGDEPLSSATPTDGAKPGFFRRAYATLDSVGEKVADVIFRLPFRMTDAVTHDNVANTMVFGNKRQSQPRPPTPPIP